MQNKTNHQNCFNREMSAKVRILIINPNSSRSMTDALGDSIEKLDYKDSHYAYFTSPEHPTHPTGLISINDLSDAALSATHALPLLLPLLEAHDAFLVACYSPHPLVQQLKTRTRKPVIGIFEASIAAGVQMLRVRLVKTSNGHHHLMERERSGDFEYDEADVIHRQVSERMSIITTTSAWVPVLCKALSSSQPEMLGAERFSQLFSAVESIGLDPAHLDHSSPEVGMRINRAVWALADDVGVVILGCAGMVGMEGWVQEALTEKAAAGTRVVDGVKAGVGILQGLVRSRFSPTADIW